MLLKSRGVQPQSYPANSAVDVRRSRSPSRDQPTSQRSSTPGTVGASPRGFSGKVEEYPFAG